MESQRTTYIEHDNSDLGEVQISNDVLAVISAMAAMEVDGVVAMAGNITAELVSKLGMKKLSKGVRVDVVDNTVMVDLSIILRINENIVTISKKVQDKVKTTVENMKNKIREANISLVISKIFSGLNMNALKYLLPLWMSPLTGVTLRCTFAAVAFWIIGFFTKPETSTRKDKILLFLLGALGIYGFMFFYLIGLSKTTPVSSSIFSSLQPIWVFILSVLFFKETITKMKVTGILIGLGGALLCILTQKSDDLASDALTGNILCLLSSVAYAVYLIASNRILKNVGVMTMLRYTFSGAAFSGIIVSTITGFDAAVLTSPIHWKPMGVLLFVLIFPTVISYLLVPIGLKYLKTTLVAIYGYLILIVATITSLALGQDRFSWTQLIAVLLICSSVYFVEIAENKEK